MTTDGLHHDRGGRGRRLVLAHGFTQNGRCWGSFDEDLAADHEVVAVDLPGHGRTGARYDQVDLVEAGKLLVDAGGTAVYVGYSMGGRVALHAALARPEAIAGLVLIGATAGIDDPAERDARHAADAALADRLEAIGLDRFLDDWLAGPLFAGLGDRAAARAERLTNRAEGVASNLRACGTGTQTPLWDDLRRLTMPTLVLVGDRDEKFTTIGHRLVASLGRASLVSLPGTHAVHLEEPARAAEEIRRFVAALDSP